MTCSAEFPTSVLCFKVWSPLQRIDQGKRTRVLKKFSYPTLLLLSSLWLSLCKRLHCSSIYFSFLLAIFLFRNGLLLACCLPFKEFWFQRFIFCESFNCFLILYFRDFFHGFELWNFELKFILNLGLTIWIMFQSCWIFDQKEILDQFRYRYKYWFWRKNWIILNSQGFSAVSQGAN